MEQVNCSQKLTDNFAQLGNPSTKWHFKKKKKKNIALYKYSCIKLLLTHIGYWIEGNTHKYKDERFTNTLAYTHSHTCLRRITMIEYPSLDMIIEKSGPCSGDECVCVHVVQQT